MSTLRLLKQVQDQLHCSPGSLYSGKSRGRYPFLTRTGPEGRQGRDLWIDVQAFNAWAQAWGIKSRIEQEGGQR